MNRRLQTEQREAPATGPFSYPAIAKPEAAALKALAAGTADGIQQRLALACIRQKICVEDQVSFVPSDPSSSAFIEGRRFVGVTVRQIIAADIDNFPEVNHG